MSNPFTALPNLDFSAELPTSFTLGPSAAWLDTAQTQLAAIERLSVGCDSHVSESPDGPTIHRARVLLACLAKASSLPKPHIHPTPAGGVQFEWEKGARYFEIELTSPREAQLYFQDRQAGREEEATLHDGDSLEPVFRYLQQVLI